MDQVDTAGPATLRSFVAGLRTDHAAVLNGLTLPYSSGPVEGTVNRIILWNSALSMRRGRGPTPRSGRAHESMWISLPSCHSKGPRSVILASSLSSAREVSSSAPTPTRNACNVFRLGRFLPLSALCRVV